MYAVLNDCNEYLKRLTLLKNNLSTSFLSKVVISLNGNKTPLDKVSVLVLVERGKVSITLKDKNHFKQVLLSLKKNLEGFNLWMKDTQTIVCQQPEITADYRKEVLKLTKNYIESAKLRVRDIRRVWKKKINGAFKSKDLLKKSDTELQKLTDLFIDKITSAYNGIKGKFGQV